MQMVLIAVGWSLCSLGNSGNTGNWPGSREIDKKLFRGAFRGCVLGGFSL